MKNNLPEEIKKCPLENLEKEIKKQQNLKEAS